MKLSNDDTPVAKYAHDARDNSAEARDYAKQAFEMSQNTHQIVVDHVTNTGLHRVPR